MNDVTLIGGEEIKNSKMQIDYTPMYKFLENHQNLKQLNMLEVAKQIYAFSMVYAKLTNEDYEQRIDFLTKQNTKWFVKADQAAPIIENLNKRVAELEQQLKVYSDAQAQTNQKQPSSENC